MGFTDNQIKAIELRKRDILVSAAAGSGKTSVLVERIIRRICDDKPSVDVDRLLIMTFTNAAASEMKERIREAIDLRIEKCEVREEYENLRRQALLVHNAQITTIHGFCQKIIRDHYEEIGIDPNFRVGDENECKLLRIDAVDECLEEAYGEGNPGFLKAVECFSGSKSDKSLSDLILGLYNFSQASPDPAEFLQKCEEPYLSGCLEEFMELDFFNAFLELKDAALEELMGYISEGYRLIEAYPCIEGYRVTMDELGDCLKRGAKALSARDCEETGRILGSLSLGRLKTITNKGLNEDEIAARDRVKEIKSVVKDGIDRLAGDFSDSPKGVYEKMSSCRDEVSALCALVSRFEEIYTDKKRDKNIIDFGDMEHMAIGILSRNREIAGIYRDLFEEIYVDEYQDSNLTQEMLVNLIKRPDGNVFTVGDVKQSIYRFRMARPDLFISKFESFTDEDSKAQRVLLNDNFRSRKEVVCAVNEIFEVIMKREFGKIEYDETARLNYGATYYELTSDNADSTKASEYRAEIILGSPEELSNAEFQANVIANRINSLVKGRMQVYDKAKKIQRDVRFSDFVILLRTLRGWEGTFREVLTGADIPVAVTGSEGYFTTVEVQTALSFLSIVDNPHQDIPFAAVMRSPIGGFTDAEMGQILEMTREVKIRYSSMYLRVKALAEESVSGDGHREDDKLSSTTKKCGDLMDLLARYRKMSIYSSVEEILRKFIDEEYGDYVRIMSKGVQRVANLNMLLSKAVDFGKTSYKGLYHFVRYMELIRKYEMDYGEAGVLGENDDVVRIMTIHKSKGLEFPVCFVAGIEKARNTQDEKKKVVWDVTYGLGCDYTDVKRRTKKNTLLKSLIREQLFRENLAEEMRVLYVAATRAREKLIMVGTYKKDDPFEKRPNGISDCKSFLDMLTLAAKEDGLEYFDVVYESEKNLVEKRASAEFGKEAGREAVILAIRDCMKGSAGLDGEIAERLSFVYPYEDMPRIALKVSVSDLKHRAIEEKRAAGEELFPEGKQLFAETEPEKYIPRFARLEGQSEKGGTFYGTAFHRILELWEYKSENVTPEEVAGFVRICLEKNHMDKDQADAVKANDIAFFLNSDLGQRMKRAADEKKLYREQPFVLGMSAEEVYPEIVANTENSKQEAEYPDVLVQGIIDAYFVEDGEITIVDYKTDYVTDANMLVNRYRTQLEYYKKALSRITGMKVKALVIYSSKLRMEVPIPM